MRAIVMQKYWQRWHYRHRVLPRLVLDRSFLITLVVMLGFSYAARHIVLLRNPNSLEAIEQQFKALKLESIQSFKPPPEQLAPPPPPVTVIVQLESVPEVITTPIRPIREKQDRRQLPNEKVSLQLNVEIDLNTADSVHLDLGKRSLAMRERLDIDDTFSLSATATSSRGERVAQLVLETPKLTSKARVAEATPEIRLTVPQEPQKNTVAVADDVDLGTELLQADVALQLASTDISMGVEEYKLWNRINAEFDRWDKGRHGKLPDNLQRRGLAIVGEFVFDGGVVHRIVWLRGTTRIYVLGKLSHDRTTELQRALTALIQLNVHGGKI